MRDGVAIVIPTWNGRRLLAGCLAAVARQDYPVFETIVVDDGSTDDTVAWLAANHPSVRLVPLPTNRGFTAAVNAGIRATDAEIVALLNNDAEPEPGWLLALVGALGCHPAAGMATSKLLLFDRRDHLHSAGDFYTLAGLPGNRGAWERDLGQYDADRWVFGACAGAAAYRRAMLDEIGLFDEDLGSYCEDVELSFRAQLAGYRCLYVPEARVYHRVSATGGGIRASYSCGRNFIAVLAKDFPSEMFRRHWRRIVAAQVRLAVEALRHGREPAARARLRGQLAGLVALPHFLARRAAVRRLRRVDTTYLEELLAEV